MEKIHYAKGFVPPTKTDSIRALGAFPCDHGAQQRNRSFDALAASRVGSSEIELSVSDLNSEYLFQASTEPLPPPVDENDWLAQVNESIVPPPPTHEHLN